MVAVAGVLLEDPPPPTLEEMDCGVCGLMGEIGLFSTADPDDIWPMDEELGIPACTVCKDGSTLCLLLCV